MAIARSRSTGLSRAARPPHGPSSRVGQNPAIATMTHIASYYLVVDQIGLHSQYTIITIIIMEEVVPFDYVATDRQLGISPVATDLQPFSMKAHQRV